MGNKILYLECYSGISGDMTVAALLDLVKKEDFLRKALESLHVDGYRVETGRREKCGIDAASFDVILEQEHHHDHSHHDHNHSHGENHSHAHIHDRLDSHGHGHDHEHNHEHNQEHNHEHNHEHEHEHHHYNDHEHDHSHDHNHIHRNIHDIYNIIEDSEITSGAKTLAKKVFAIVAVAESKAHGLPVDEVHFHEVGAVDSIVDIVSACVLVDELGVDEIVVSELYEGTGHVWCQHGVIPVPVPATLNIVVANDLELKITDTKGEMITPTGAALAAAFRTRKTLPSSYKLINVGLGAGKKDFKHANILRAYLLEDSSKVQKSDDEVVVLESNLDDSTGEVLGFVMERLMEIGAKDVFYTPIYMKKNRPAYKLSVICTTQDRMQMEDTIFTHTSAIGIRRSVLERTVLEREFIVVETSYGKISVKCVKNGEDTYYSPEYEDIKEILKSNPISYQHLYNMIMREVGK